MIEDAHRSDRPVDLIIVHSLSRFFRDLISFGPAALAAALAAGRDPVPSSVEGWWAGQDSNLQLRRYERRVLAN